MPNINYRTADIHTTQISTPVGEMTLMSVADRLICCDWADGWHSSTVRNRLAKYFKGKRVSQANDTIRQAQRELEEYFARERKDFDVKVLFAGTDFQKAVWKALTEIPYGGLTTYGELAHAVGSPQASRAVGAAVGNNPCSIIVPCHRVLGTGRCLTGFGGGYAAKVKLLEIEGFEIVQQNDGAEARWKVR